MSDNSEDIRILKSQIFELERLIRLIMQKVGI